MMGYERYPRGTNPQGDYYNRSNPQDYGRDYGSGGEFSYSSARDYQAADELRDRDDFGRRDTYGSAGDRAYANRSYGGSQSDYGMRGDYGSNAGYGARDSYGSRSTFGGRNDYGDRDYGRMSSGAYDMGDRNRTYDRGYQADRGYERNDRSNRVGNDYGRQPQGYNYQDRGFVARAGDEVRSWFGDDDAERRRQMDQRYDERAGRGDRYSAGNYGRDADYHDWRQQQIHALDRDYDEYRNENRSKFHAEFGSWRKERETQRSSLGQVQEHMEVVGSDGQHVGTVDKVRGDRIILTKNDKDAGGHHHSIPSRWIQSVADKVTISKSASDAQSHWKDEERNQAFFADNNDEHHADDANSRTMGDATASSRSYSTTK